MHLKYSNLDSWYFADDSLEQSSFVFKIEHSGNFFKKDFSSPDYYWLYIIYSPMVQAF